jgi:nicotinamidase-related amidase
MNQKIRPIGPDAIHVCIDMQRIFAERTAWYTPSIPTILPAILRLTGHCPGRSVFTRFCTPPTAADAPGNWRRYYERWAELTTDVLGAEMLDVIAELAAFSPPAQIADKTTYSAFESAGFCAVLDDLGCRCIIFTGVETDVCVLGTVMQAMDRGYRVIIAEDGVHSSSPEAHRAALDLIYRRFEDQLEIGPADEIIANWSPL